MNIRMKIKYLLVSGTLFSISNTFSGFRVLTYFRYSELCLSNMENLRVYKVDISTLEKHDSHLKINQKFDSCNMSYNVSVFFLYQMIRQLENLFK